MKRSGGWMFGAYCLLAGSEWLLAPVPLRVRGLAYLLLGLAALVAGGRRGFGGVEQVARLSLGAVFLVGMPEAVGRWAGGYVAGSLGTVVLGLVPVMVVMVAAYVDGDEVRRLLVPAVAGLGGLLLLVPVGLPGGGMEMVAALVLWGSAVLIAVVGVWIYPLLRGFGWVQGVAVFCVANALVFLGAGLIGGRSAWDWREGWGGTVVVGVEVMFLVGALRGWESVRAGARFLVVPLVTIVEGLVLLRPELTGRMVVGMALLAGGAGWLVWSRAERPTLSLR
jgi:drug/metabolite transporter (DMT)-like permease